jgi:hypothetical protein
LQIFSAQPGGACEKCLSTVKTASGRIAHWSRQDIAEFLLTQARSGQRFLAGIDHCFSFPWSYFQRYGLRSWLAFMDDFVVYWPTDQQYVYVDFVREGVLHEKGRTPHPGLRTGKNDELRMTERWTSSAKSVFHFNVHGSVAKSSHAGIPWLRWLREQAGDRLHFWPFDGWEPVADKSVIVEVYPSILRKRYSREKRTVDEHDAYAIARWMTDMDVREALAGFFAPPLSDEERRIADCEGWIFGIR